VPHDSGLSGRKFVSGVEFGDGDVQDFQILADGAVAAAGLDEDGGAGGERMDLAVELDVALAFEDVVELGHALVVVQLAIVLDLDEVHRGDGVGLVHEGAARLPARAGSGRDVGKAGHLEAFPDDFVLHGDTYASQIPFEKRRMRLFRFRHDHPPGNKIRDMTEFTLPLRLAALSLLLLPCACEKAPPQSPPPGAASEAPLPAAPASPAEEESILIEAAQKPRQLSPEEQQQVIDGILQARAKQQAEGLGTGTVKVNGAWPYTGYSVLAPDPAAAIEARLVAVDVTVAGHTPFFDLDDIEIVDGATLVSYGSDPHAEPLRLDGTLLPAEEAIPDAPAASRWLLIYAFPKATKSFRLLYWGKTLTPEPVEFGKAGLSLPYPPGE